MAAGKHRHFWLKICFPHGGPNKNMFMLLFNKKMCFRHWRSKNLRLNESTYVFEDIDDFSQRRSKKYCLLLLFLLLPILTEMFFSIGGQQNMQLTKNHKIFQKMLK